jgi:hypothetical protein
MGNRVLVVATSDIGADEINSTLHSSSQLAGRIDAASEVRVVAPASGLSKLAWLTNADDDAREDAAGRAEEVADALPADSVETEVGDTDPLQAIIDALRTFDADEVVVVTRTADEASWLEHGTVEAARDRLKLPVTHLVVG